MWLLNQMFPDNSAYNIPSLFRIKGPFAAATMEAALQSLVARHEIFRTTFQEIEGELNQVVHDEIHLRLESGLHEIQGEKPEPDPAREWINREITRPFDLASGPLLRAGYVKTGEDEFLVLIVMHHIITDLRSKDLMAAELEGFYNHPSNDPRVYPSGPVISYSDFVASDHDFESRPKYESMLSFWRGQVDQADTAIDLSADYPRPAVLTLQGKAKTLTIDRELTEKLK